VEPREIHLPSPRELAAEFDLRPKKRLGQCFLDNHRTLDRIVAAAELDPETNAVEIGPGPGYLTVRILRRTRRVCAIELDERFRPVHERYFGDLDPPVRFIYADALRLDWAALHDELGEPYVVIGNIPYQITSPLLGLLLELTPAPQRSVLLVQREFAQRLASEPGRRSYGALTVKTSLFAHVRQALFVPRQRFQPWPRVDAAAIVIEPRRPPLIDPADRPSVNKLVDACFAHRRKKIINSLLDTAYLGTVRETAAGLLTRAGIDPARRPETVTAEEFLKLAQLVAQNHPDSLKAGSEGAPD
jgi:16S rRNA (adenine1518-N6/adenine1519-N6)-dimethyltransferase